MSDLRRLLRRVDDVTPPDLWPDIERREPRRPPDRRLVAGAVAVALSASGIALVSTAFFGERERLPRPRTPVMAVDPRITAEIPVGQFPQEIAAGEGAVWVTVNESDAPERWYVARIDPATNQVTDRIDVFEAGDVAVGAGGVWVSSREQRFGQVLVLIDPEMARVARTIPIGCSRCHISQLVADASTVWVTLSTDYPDSGQVVRVDPATTQVVARITVPGDPRDLVVQEAGVWVYSLTHFVKELGVTGGTLYRIDPATNSLAATILPGEVPPISGISGPPVLAAGYGAVWSSQTRAEGLGEEVVRIDPVTGQAETIGLEGPFFPFGVGYGGVWFRGDGASATDIPSAISRLDPATLRVNASLGIDTHAVDAALDPATGTIWVANYEGPVTRIDLR